MATEIIMPKAGMTMEEGTIIKWYKRVGEHVSVGEPLLEIITDKVNMEVEAEVSGTLLEIIGQEDEVLPVFTVIGYIGEAEEQIGENAGKDTSFNRKIRATPAARQKAKENNINLETVQGTGPNHRVQKQDVVNYLAQDNQYHARYNKNLSPHAKRLIEKHKINSESVTGTGHKGKIMARDVLHILEHLTAHDIKQTAEQTMQKNEVQGAVESNGYTEVPLTHVERTIAQRMSDSHHMSPTFSLQIEVDMQNAKMLLAELKEQTEKVKPTFTDMILLKAGRALMEHKTLNATLAGNHIRMYNHANIALAVGLEDGLRVPVISAVEQQSLLEIAQKRAALVGKAQAGTLSLDDSKDSTFTISNLGMYGITSFTSIINQPNSAILSVGAIKDTVVYLGGGITVRPIMNMTLTLDHRITDGVKGAKFLQSLKSYLENPKI